MSKNKTLSIGEKTYDLDGLDRFSLIDLIRLQQVSADYTEDGRGLSMTKLQKGLSGKESDLVALGGLIWLVRARAGERISFEEALDFPMADFRIEGGDDEPASDEPAEAGEGANPTDAA